MSISTLFRSLRNSILLWWRGDRVRVSPEEGRFWRLQPGNLLTINGQSVEIRHRSVQPGSESKLLLVCHVGDESACLVISSRSDRQLLQMSWTTASGTRELQITDVQIWG